MKYAIIANPVSGKTSIDAKRLVLSDAAKILRSKIFGLDTISPVDFCQCAQELAWNHDVLVIAGGDGTFSDVINAVDTSITTIAYLPLGSGNAMRYALGYKGNLVNIAQRIRNGDIYAYDLINCDDKKKAFMASVGIEGSIIQLRDKFIAYGQTGFMAYFNAVCISYFKNYVRTFAQINIDGESRNIKNLLSLMIVKQPYYGYGMNVVPNAKFDDQQLHVSYINSTLLKCLVAGMASFTIGNRFGQYYSGKKLTVLLEKPLFAQIDGNSAWEANSFAFTILPQALKIKY